MILEMLLSISTKDMIKIILDILTENKFQDLFQILQDN